MLLAEDEETLRELVEHMLASLGYEVAATDSGPAAIGVLQVAPGGFDLLLTDQTMPRLTGLQLARQAQQLQPGLPVLLMTGFSHQVDEPALRDAGVTGLLLKPFSLRELATAVADTIRRDDRE